MKLEGVKSRYNFTLNSLCSHYEYPLGNFHHKMNTLIRQSENNNNAWNFHLKKATIITFQWPEGINIHIIAPHELLSHFHPMEIHGFPAKMEIFTLSGFELGAIMF